MKKRVVFFIFFVAVLELVLMVCAASINREYGDPAIKVVTITTGMKGFLLLITGIALRLREA